MGTNNLKVMRPALIFLIFITSVMILGCSSPAITPQPTVTVEPTSSPLQSPTPTQEFTATPTPIPPNTTQSPTKIDSGLSDLLRHYEHPDMWRPPEMVKVFAQAEKVGGLSIGFTADHELSENELSELESEFGARFTKDQYGKVVHIGKIHYTAIVPFDKIRALANLPYIENVSTGAWPPGVLPGSGK